MVMVSRDGWEECWHRQITGEPGGSGIYARGFASRRGERHLDLRYFTRLEDGRMRPSSRWLKVSAGPQLQALADALAAFSSEEAWR